MLKIIKNKFKFWRLILGFVFLFPISTIIACGGSSQDGPIKLAMRASDFKYWDPIIKKFKAKTGIEVNFHIASNQIQNYETWNSAGSLPDICLVDNNTLDKSRNKTWFTNINVAEFAKSIYDVADKKENFDLSNSALYDANFFKTVQKNNGKEVAAIPYSFGKSAIYLNSKLIDSTKNLYAKVPKIDGHGFLELDIEKKATPENIAAFIMNAGERGVTGLPKGKTLNGWMDYGPGAFYQRLASVGLSASKDDIGYTFGGLVEDMSFSIGQIIEFDGVFNPTKKIIDDDKLKEVLKRPRKQDGNWNAEDHTYYKNLVKPFYESLYGYFDKNILGANVSPAILGENGKAEIYTKLFGLDKREKASILFGPQWFVAGYFEDNWDVLKKGRDNSKKGNKILQLYDDVWTLPVPYSVINFETLAISRALADNPERRSEVYKFLRYALKFNKENKITHALDILGSKATSPIVAANKQLTQNLESKVFYKQGVEPFNGLNVGIKEMEKLNEQKRKFERSFFLGGQKWDYEKNQVRSPHETVDTYKGLAGGVAVTSTKGKYFSFASSISGHLEKKLKNFYNKEKQASSRKTLDEITSFFMQGVLDSWNLFDIEDL